MKKDHKTSTQKKTQFEAFWPLCVLYGLVIFCSGRGHRGLTCWPHVLACHEDCVFLPPPFFLKNVVFAKHEGGGLETDHKMILIPLKINMATTAMQQMGLNALHNT